MTKNKKRPPGTPRAKRKSDLKGIVCPECRVPMDVLDTRARAKGIIVRRRVCPICNDRLTTTERPKAA